MADHSGSQASCGQAGSRRSHSLQEDLYVLDKWRRQVLIMRMCLASPVEREMSGEQMMEGSSKRRPGWDLSSYLLWIQLGMHASGRR
jgi:hypothetical protein